MIHHAWIAPIWFIAPAGAAIAALGGATVGYAYSELRPSLPGRPWTAPAIAAGSALVLVPAGLIAEALGPVYAIGPGGSGTLLVDPGAALLRFVVGLLGTAALSGAVLGWLVARTRRACTASAAAALFLAIGPGHNVPLLGGTPAVAKEAVVLAAVLAVASLVLVEGDARLRAVAPTIPTTSGDGS